MISRTKSTPSISQLKPYLFLNIYFSGDSLSLRLEKPLLATVRELQLSRWGTEARKTAESKFLPWSKCRKSSS